MEKIAETTEQPKKPSIWKDFWSGFWFPIIFILGSSIFRKGFGFYAPAVWIVWGAITICICYRIEPKPKVGFIKYFLFIETGLIVFVLALWFAPKFLRATMPEFWAYTLPAIPVFIAAYFVRPFLGDGKRGNFLWCLVGSVALAALFGWFISGAPESKN